VIYFLNGKINEVKIGPIPAGTPVNLIAYGAAILAMLFLVLSQLVPARASQFLLLSVCLGVFAIFALVIHWQWSNINEYYQRVPVWFPSLVLLLAGFTFYFLFVSDHRQLVRFSAYCELVLAIVLGGVIYFLNGKINEVKIGPIPAGTPVNLIASINPEANRSDLIEASMSRSRHSPRSGRRTWTRRKPKN